MFTQIYSIQTAEEALACIEAGADRIGLLVGVHGGKFPCGTSNCTYCSFSDICNSSKEEEIWGGLI